VDLEYRTVEDLAKAAIWLKYSLQYARQHSQWEAVRLLEAVGTRPSSRVRCSLCRQVNI
jgi:hypothetical protein